MTTDFCRLFILVIFASLLTGCFSRGMQSSGKAGNRVETFYKGEGKTLYYVKAVTFKDDSSRVLKIDFTYNHNSADSLKDSVAANFSIFSKKKLKVDHIGFSMNERALYPASVIFINAKKNKIVGRYTAKMPYEEFRKLINSASPEVILVSEEQDIALFKPKKWKKTSAVISEQLIENVEFSFRN